MTNANLLENPATEAEAALFTSEVSGEGQLVYQLYVALVLQGYEDGMPLEAAKAAFSLDLMTEVSYDGSQGADGYGHARKWELRVRDTRFKLLAYQDGSPRTFFYAYHPEVGEKFLGCGD